MQTLVIDPRKVRDISAEFLTANGDLRVVPAAQYAATTPEERSLFGVRNALYGFPTVELIAFLKGVIGKRTAIEIGAGAGNLARALGIPATDNRQQERPDIVAYYQTLRQPVIQYGEHVERLDALAAIQKYRPQVVLGSWVTHKYDERRHSAGGNQDGVDEEAVIAACEAYIFIGNEHVHRGKSIWSLPHTKMTPEWLYSRAFNGSKNFIAVWENLTKP